MTIEPADCDSCMADLISVDYLAPGAKAPYKLLLDKEPIEAFLVDPKRPMPLSILVHLRHSATCEARGPREAGASEQAEEAAEITPEQEGEISPAPTPSSSEPPRPDGPR